ncbi:MAG TPA: hypothetical protein VFY87_20830, partial [Geminicoccaceae bacterium]|nr:hypothetical protein [Geminicoccaceae bacterium]
MRRRPLPLLAAVVAAALSGCGEGTWLGQAEPPPLPGERKSVLLIEEGLQADPRLAQLDVVLPPPERNTAWPQSGGNPTHAMQHLAAADTIDVAWRADAGAGSSGGSRLLAGPIVAAGSVFVVDAEGEIAAFGA